MFHITSSLLGGLAAITAWALVVSVFLLAHGTHLSSDREG